MEHFVEEWKAFAAESDNTGLAAVLEESAAEELIAAKELLPEELMAESGLAEFSTVGDLLGNRNRLLEIAGFFSSMSVSCSTGDEDGLVLLEMHLWNTELFVAVLLLDMAATLYHVTCGIPLKMKVFVEGECDEDLAETIWEIVSCFPDVVKCDVAGEDEPDESVEEENGSPAEEESSSPVEDTGNEVDSEADTAAFKNEWTLEMDRLAVEYGKNPGQKTYGDIIAMLINGLGDFANCWSPVIDYDDPEKQLSGTYLWSTKKHDKTYLTLLTRPCDEFRYTVKFGLSDLFRDAEDESLSGIRINPGDEDIVIDKNILKAIRLLFVKAVEIGKAFAAEEEQDERVMDVERPMSPEAYELAARTITELVQDDVDSFFVLNFTDLQEDDEVLFMQTKRCDNGYRVEIAYDMSDFDQKPLILAADDVDLEATLMLFREVGLEGKPTGDIEFIENNFKDIGFGEE